MHKRQEPTENMKMLQLRTTITPENLSEVETQLASIICDSLLAYRNRFGRSQFYGCMLGVAVWLGWLGLALSLVLLAIAPDGRTRTLSVALLVVFPLLVMALRYRTRHRHNPRVYRPYWLWLARVRAKRMLRVARKTAPFVAEYDLRGDLASYYRIKDERATLVWSRRIAGYGIRGPGFTLLFKKPTSTYPYGLILHEASSTLEAHLTELGVQARG
jgi:hypothetical protein